ncbi:MAG: glycerate kinase [Planctomycetes bacterium]|nr:glycerate kinase [Planctomycetota bacterium]
MIEATGGTLHRARVTGPLGMPVTAEWGSFEAAGAPVKTAIIEIAAAAGLHLIPMCKRDPTHTTTFGVGQLIGCAVEAGCDPIIIGLGGSATCDGGAGMAQALGCCFTLDGGQVADVPMTGGLLSRVTDVNRSTIAPEYRDGQRLLVACDVDNPLCGPRGSAAVYGPQKGASPEQVTTLDDGLRHLASLMPDIDHDFPGAGAAGGFGFGFKAFCNARIERGIDLVLQTLNFSARAASADLVITGEGCIDSQTMHGKAVHGVAQAGMRARHARNRAGRHRRTRSRTDD